MFDKKKIKGIRFKKKPSKFDAESLNTFTEILHNTVQCKLYVTYNANIARSFHIRAVSVFIDKVYTRQTA